MRVKIFTGIFIALLIAPMHLMAEVTVHHDLKVRLHPNQQTIDATDAILLTGRRSDELFFTLHPNLSPRALTAGVDIKVVAEESRTTTYRIIRTAGDDQPLVIAYSGRLHHDLGTADYARGIRRTRGLISGEGVYLDGDTNWYPDFDEPWLTFSLQVEMPEGWEAVSQGHWHRLSAKALRWSENKPQDQIYLTAGKLFRYTQDAQGTMAMVYLRRPDPALAARYLSATGGYLTMYSGLIGPYPYDKFALVENFWETGFGMPSFSLLGPKVIRFPFILYSSYPHEILHNWWGNGVFPDYAAGNWAEGLTAYLADHLIQAQQGRAAEYRQGVLQKYRDFASGGNDIPLAAFTSRHSAATEAVGYGKALMFFHMLRRRMGDDRFVAGLRSFYKRYCFTRAGYNDLQRTLEAAAGISLERPFDQWVRRTGAPQLTVVQATVERVQERFRLDLTLHQRQAEAPYALQVPLAVTLAGASKAHFVDFNLQTRQQSLTLTFDRQPLRLDVDPRFDLFRKLDRAEIPPALSQLYGAHQVTVVLPATAAPELLDAYRQFARRLAHDGPEKVTVTMDKALKQLPAKHSVLLLGWDNRFLNVVAEQVSTYGASITPKLVQLHQLPIQRTGHSVVLAARHPKTQDQVLVWIAADPLPALDGLARKLPHYHKYSYLVFTGSEPENIAKGRWPATGSPMTVYFTDRRPPRAALPVEPPLAKAR